MGGVWVAFTQFRRTPVGNSVHRKRRRIGRHSDLDSAAIGAQIVNSIRHRPPQRILWEVVPIDLFWLVTPNLSRILEIAHQLLLFGIGATRLADCTLARVYFWR
jgi:hypothetical protein